VKANEKGIRIYSELSPDIPDFVIGDPTRFNQILFNIAGNAVKFTHEGYVKIKLTLIERTANHISLRIDIEDTGIGIPADKLPQIFESFSQAGVDITRKYGGTGLGLAITKSLVEMQGGRIEVKSEPGKGSCFTVFISYRISSKVHEMPDKAVKHEFALFNGENVLVVDDNQINLIVAGKFLSKWNLNIDQAENGLEALEKFKQKKFALVLMDLQMPEMDGFTVATFIKKNRKTSHIPIIFISAVFVSEEFIKRGYKTGAIDYLAKPIDDNLLLNKISFYIKLFEKEKELQIEKERFQNILDLQDNIVVVVDKINMMYANKAFTEFFNVGSLNGFLKKYKCICDKFIAEDDFLIGDDTKSWIDVVINNRYTQHVACMLHEDKKRYFAVNVNILSLELEQFVCTFTDITELKTESLNFERESVLDPLTHIYNRRMFERESKKMLYLANKYRFELSLMVLDIDHFKAVNDTFGHQVGDEVLIEIASRILQSIRKGDLFARYGGEEFVIMMLQKSELVFKKAHDINKIISSKEFDTVGKVTISIGVANKKEGESVESLFARADRALYEAKENGRNRVEIGE